MKKGFSLIEILVGMGLMAVIMAAGVVLLFAALRTSKKAANVGAAKSEGAYAINSMSQKIRYAKSIACTGSDLTVNFFDNSNTVYSLSGSKIVAKTTSGANVTTANLTSAKVNVSGCPLFSCSTSLVTICMNVTAVSGATDVTEAGSAAFQTQVNLRNYGN